MNKLFDVAGKVAVVTGGGRGIGLMISSTLVAVRMLCWVVVPVA
jgi:NAD(P)-dependent dehydrogenase (short-subunit alcohol dehydrogenase family)